MHTQVKLVVTMKLSAEPSPSSSGYAGEQGSSVASSASIEEPYPAPGAMDSCATRSTPTRPRRWPWLGSFTIRSTSELIRFVLALTKLFKYVRFAIIFSIGLALAMHRHSRIYSCVLLNVTEKKQRWQVKRNCL
ncbi:uncharacterized protein LOC125542310 isoform X2 [Triticum urartu]|uniref:uncharacterized protein LOC125542310 isoform X2 n=1 Tax=Triticum urartu TaxID=4572 RepID=UPI002044CE00|nr:uncharacterized protein LOC125542310 isoform X2 [Triticum urartu]